MHKIISTKAINYNNYTFTHLHYYKLIKQTLKSSKSISPQPNGHTAYPMVYLTLRQSKINHTLKTLIIIKQTNLNSREIAIILIAVY